jgi:hypothetical protein
MSYLPPTGFLFVDRTQALLETVRWNLPSDQWFSCSLLHKSNEACHSECPLASVQNENGRLSSHVALKLTAILNNYWKTQSQLHFRERGVAAGFRQAFSEEAYKDEESSGSEGPVNPFPDWNAAGYAVDKVDSSL